MTTVLKYLRLPFFFDVEKLQHETDLLSAAQWQPHYQSRHYDGDWSAIALRSIGGKTDNILISPAEEEYADTPLLDKCIYFKEVLSAFDCPLQSVRLLRLGPGAVIKEHKDAELSFEKGEARIHVPVRTNAGVEFLLDGERIVMNEGECWYMNFNLPHSIRNTGATDRIHLVIDVKVNEWLKSLFGQPGLFQRSQAAVDVETTKNIIASLRNMNTATSNQLADEMESAMLSATQS